MEFTTFVTSEGKIEFKDMNLRELAGKAKSWVMEYEPGKSTTVQFRMTNHTHIIIKRFYNSNKKLKTQENIYMMKAYGLQDMTMEDVLTYANTLKNKPVT